MYHLIDTCFINEHAGTARVFFIRFGGQSFLSCFTIAFWSLHGDQTTKISKCWLFEEDFPQHTLLSHLLYIIVCFCPSILPKSTKSLWVWVITHHSGSDGAGDVVSVSRVRSLLPRRARPCKSGSQWI